MAKEQLAYPEISKEGFVQLTSECYDLLDPLAVPKGTAPADAPILSEDINTLHIEAPVEHVVGRFLTIKFDETRRLTIYKELTETGDTPWSVNYYEPLDGGDENEMLHTRVNISRTSGMSLQGYIYVARGGEEAHLGTANTDYSRVIGALNEAIAAGHVFAASGDSNT